MKQVCSFFVIIVLLTGYSYAFDFSYLFDSKTVRKEKIDRDKKYKKRIKEIIFEGKLNGKKITKWEARRLVLLENKQPKTKQQYEYISQDVKNFDKEIKTPKPVEDELDKKVVNFPQPYYSIEKYNKPAGSVEIDLTLLEKNKKVNSNALVSSDYTKLVYSSVFFHNYARQTISQVYLIYLDQTILSKKKRILNAFSALQEKSPIMSTSLNTTEPFIQRTLTAIDFNFDNTKVAIKEKIANKRDGTWATRLYVYDFKTYKLKYLNEVSEAIKYWWLKNKKLYLPDYRWDIYPIGWSKNDKDCIIVLAYSYTGKTPKFLGSWQIDSNGKRTKLLSLSLDKVYDIQLTGLTLRMHLQ